VLGLCLGMLVGTSVHALAYVVLVACFNWDAEAARALRRVGAKLGDAPPGAVAVAASSAEGEAAPEAQQPLLQEHREAVWRHTSDGGAAGAGPLGADGAAAAGADAASSAAPA